MMFWIKRTIESKEFQELFAKFENLRIEVEAVKIELALYKLKLHKRAGIKLKDDVEEEQNSKEPKVLLAPDGTTPK